MSKESRLQETRWKTDTQLVQESGIQTEINTEEIKQPSGMHMPAEFEPQEGVIVIWPVRPGSFGRDPKPAQRAFLQLIRLLSRYETVYLLAGGTHLEEAKAASGGYAKVLQIESNDAWARDTGPTFVTDGDTVAGISWQFNAWGGKVDGLYSDYEQDQLLAAEFCRQTGYPCFDNGDFILEGGAVHSDGEGTLLVTESCLLSKGRNAAMSKEQIEERLLETLGGTKVLWLPRGIAGDETNEHVDNVCAFVAPGEVVLAWTDRTENPQYPLCRQNLDYLNSVTDAKGRTLVVHKLPLPDYPVCLTAEDCEKYEYEEGEDRRTPGETLAASYVNFFIGNGMVAVPQFDGENKDSDRRALKVLKAIFPDRNVQGIESRELILGGGNLHCLTQQIPKPVKPH